MLLQSDLELFATEIQSVKHRAGMAERDIAYLFDELNIEKNRSLQLDSEQRSFENHLKELQSRLEETEALTLKGGIRTIQ